MVRISMKLALAAVAFAVLLQSALAAEPAFPSTPILDNFDRPDEPAPGGPMWISTGNPNFPGQTGIAVIDNKAMSADPDESASSSWMQMFGQDQEAYFEYGDTPGTNAGMGPAVRLQDPTDALSNQYLVFFYQLVENNKTQVIIWKRFGSNWTNIAETFLSQDLDRGDQIGIRAVGGRIDAYLNSQVVLSVTDSQPILEPGYIRLYVGDDIGHSADNFGGGDVVDDGSGGGTGIPEMVQPVPGSVLPGSNASFSWTANGAAVSQWWLQASSTQGGNELANVNLNSALSTTLTGLPTDGSFIWVRLWYRIGSIWSSQDHQYVAASGPGNSGEPELLTPSAGTFSGSSETFSWTGNGAPVTRWWLQAGASIGGNEIVNVDLGTALSTTQTELPTDGSTVWVRLWYLLDGNWLSQDYQFTASGP